MCHFDLICWFCALLIIALLLDFRLSRACPFASCPFVPCAILYLDDAAFSLSNYTEIGGGLCTGTSLCCCADLCYASLHNFILGCNLLV
jgi:hypothetical protein